MNEQLIENQRPNFQAELLAILSTPVTVETINVYAETALNQVIELSRAAVHSYAEDLFGEDPGIVVDEQIESEAFAHYDLDEVGLILDHIQAKDLEIKQLDDFISKLPTKGHVYVPPTELDVPESLGKTKRKTAELQPRLKTLLFILANEFGLDIEDPKQVDVSDGVMEQAMQRSASYDLVEAPTIGRSVLICDESGNATYVFDHDAIARLGSGPKNDISKLNKDELDALIDVNNGLGQKIHYSNNFVLRLIAALRGTESTDEISVGSYLRPKDEDGILSLAGISRAFGISEQVIKRTIIELGDELGEKIIYQFGGTAAPGYSEFQQQQIRLRLQSIGYLTLPPEGYLNAEQVAASLDLEVNWVYRALKRLDTELGDIQSFKGRRRPIQFYSSDQQQQIKGQLEADGAFLPEAPEDYRTIGAMKSTLEISHHTIVRVIDSLRDQLGEIGRYRFGANATEGLSPAQQAAIIEELKARDIFAELAPDDVFSIPACASDLDVSREMVEVAIESIGETLGELKKYRFGGSKKIAVGINAEQKNRIKQYLGDHDLIVGAAPKGYRSVHGIARAHKVADATVERAIEMLADTLAEPDSYRFGTRLVRGFSPDDQRLIENQLIEMGCFVQPPEGYISTNKLAIQLGVARNTIKNAAQALGPEIGEIGEYRFNTRLSPGYSPGQQAMIANYLADKGLIERQESIAAETQDAIST